MKVSWQEIFYTNDKHATNSDVAVLCVAYKEDFMKDNYFNTANGVITKKEEEKKDQKVREHIDSVLPDEECVWENAGEYWATECDGAFYLETGTPSDNKMIYCPYCGKRLSYT